MLAGIMEQPRSPRQLARSSMVDQRVRKQELIGRNVARLLAVNKEGYTQARLAVEVGLDPSVLSDIFNGSRKRILHPQQIAKIAEILGVNPDSLNSEWPGGIIPTLDAHRPLASAGSPPIGEDMMKAETVRRAVESFEVSNPGYLTPAEREELRRHLEITKASPSAIVVQRFAQAVKTGQVEMLNQ